MAVYVCTLCTSRSPSLSLWMSHLRQVHHSSDATLSCPIGECDATYSRVNSLCSHVYRKHKEASTSAPETSAPENEDTRSNIIFDLSIPGSISHDVNQLLGRDVHEQMKKSSLFLLQLKEERLLTQAAVNDVVRGCREVFKHTVYHLKAGVSHTLAQSGIDPSDIEGLDGVFTELDDPFVGLETSYLQDKFILQELQCIVSCSWKITIYQNVQHTRAVFVCY